MDAEPREACSPDDGATGIVRRHTGSAAWVLWACPIATLILMAVSLQASQWLASRAAKDRTSFWASSEPVVEVVGPFAIGSLLFCVGVAPLMRISGVVPGDRAVIVWCMGAGFVVWGTGLAIAGSWFLWGLAHAAFCGVVLAHACSTRWIGLAPIAALPLAWVVAFIVADSRGRDDLTLYGAAVGAWNVMMSIVVAAWAARRRSRLPGREDCPACLYDRSGLAPGTPCPECGSALPPAHRSVEDLLDGPPRRRVRR